MSPPLKLLFDECCSPHLPRELRDFYHRDYPDLQIRHLMDDWTPGTPDSQWLATLREDSSWIVITKDAGKNSAPEKLPLICHKWGITHIVFTAGIINKGFVTQKNAISWRFLRMDAGGIERDAFANPSSSVPGSAT